jgi:hypothetical protein
MSNAALPFLTQLDTLALPTSPAEWPAALRMRASGDWATYYAPFDHINRNARIAIVGITPGLQQATNALRAYQNARQRGTPVDTALETAKSFASFSGPMRTNLVAMLDHIGLARWLGVPSCAELFDTRTDLAHFTSALRYPVTFRGQNYAGTPGILTNPFTRTEFEQWFVPEAKTLRDAVWVPLGPSVTNALESLTGSGLIPHERILSGLPHPSGANAERVAYFLGRKARAALSTKVDPDKLDAARATLLARVVQL